MSHTIALNDATSIPALGFGVFQIPAEQTQQAVEHALAAGYRLIDTAAAYGNEAEVGAAIRASGLPREQLYLTTKIWVQDPPAEANARAAGLRCLERLGLDHIDLLLIHQPFGDSYAHWRGLQQLQAEGVTTSIGVSNFSVAATVDLALHNDVTPAVNQIEVNPFHQRVEQVAQFQAESVAVQAWAPFAEGRAGLFTEPTLMQIADAHQATVAQVVLAWLRQRGVITLAKSIRPERMAENLASLQLRLTEAELGQIAGLDSGESQFFDHADPEQIKRLGSARRG